MDCNNILVPFFELHSAFQKFGILETLSPASAADTVAVLLFLLSAWGYFTHGRIWDKPDPHYKLYFERPQILESVSGNKNAVNRNVAKQLQEENYQLVIFWGSQSGTAERFAEILRRECLAHFGVNALVADLSEYDADSIAEIDETRFTIFILSTYGEGDPSDNASGLWAWVKQVKAQGTMLQNLRYLALGLGNSNYKYYNRVLDVVVEALDDAGATTLMPPKKADDALGETEEDFQSWKDDVFALFRGMGYETRTMAYQPTLNVELGNHTDEETDARVFLHHQQSMTNSAIFSVPIRKSRELFTAGNRNCIHMELDLGSNNVVYKTGDHIGIWPCNPDDEVECLLKALGLEQRQNQTLNVTAIDDSVRPKVPSGSTLASVLRYHLEICAPVSRKTILDLSQFAPTTTAKAMLAEVGQNRDCYTQLASSTYITLGRLLTLACPTEPWTLLPLSFVIESLRCLSPRYYSISSSSVISPRRITITVLVVNKTIKSDPQTTIHGLTSNYILSASKLSSNASTPTPHFQHALSTAFEARKIYVHVRKSKFKLPITPSTPLVLIAAGTGFAPFRAFLSERAKLHMLGNKVGRIVLFFGCRHPDSDYIYQEELIKLQENLGNKLEIVTAFSRQGETRVYVQDRVAEHAAQVLEMLDIGANIYVCGKSAMSREVDRKIEEAVERCKGLKDGEGKEWVNGLKRRGKWKADVWG
ncbi:cytochrome P450 reductase 2 [Curvularia clavata]|uniref:NADPH--cytochrome P450 reductase n=1 Tax=Curvularia clavata TaxID=95742 RepID=A0A9Q8Z4T0_CURCL|nr:cytochrome P450 reductase 2 [Curvularia clavata]